MRVRFSWSLTQPPETSFLCQQPATCGNARATGGLGAHTRLLKHALVPLAVVAELDRKKFEGSQAMKNRAAKAIRSLYGLRKGLSPDVPASFITTDNTTLALEIPRDDVGRTRSAISVDEEIRDFGVFVKQVTQRPVTVVTRDMNLQIRCQRAGLEVLWLDERDMKQDQPNTKNAGPQDKDSGTARAGAGAPAYPADSG